MADPSDDLITTDEDLYAMRLVHGHYLRVKKQMEQDTQQLAERLAQILEEWASEKQARRIADRMVLTLDNLDIVELLQSQDQGGTKLKVLDVIGVKRREATHYVREPCLIYL